MIIRDSIRRSLEDGLRSLDMTDAGVPLVLERPREAAHGDMSTPVAMALAKTLRKNPLEIAETIAAKIKLPSDIVSSVEVIKPGFINFRFADAALRQGLLTVISSGDGYGSAGIG
ncbi:MAG: arginine--tRNA ligase, partial [Candidatus Krumholzibacteria bacterium]|nr:arginine--tRNA ligase [Candidatus Krumholzibacteria bacterium]